MSSQLAAPDARLQPDIVVYHTPDSSFLHIQIHTNDLLYLTEGDTGFASTTIYYELHESFESAEILDSATLTFPLIRDERIRYFHVKIPFRKVANGILKISIADDNLKKSTDKIRVVRNTVSDLQQKFLMTDSAGRILVSSYTGSGVPFRLVSEVHGNSSLLVRCFFREFAFPLPPFSKKPEQKYNFKEDSLFSYVTGTVLTLNRQGVYHFQLDTSSNAGFTVFVMEPWFPEFRLPSQLIPPLRYLTMRNEYQELLAKDNPKEAAETFWKKTGGRNDRSKALIRIYYQRAQEANRKFTSYLPGWKTDRGMIYMVFGPPASVYRSQKLEQWTYQGETGTVVLDFRLISNPFSDNDFSLIRREEYEYPWYLWVERWRNGNINLRH